MAIQPIYYLSSGKNESFIPYDQTTVLKDNSSEDFINNSKFPKTLFHDPQGDSLVKPPLEVYYSIFSNLNLFDLTDIGFEVDNNTTWMSLGLWVEFRKQEYMIFVLEVL